MGNDKSILNQHGYTQLDKIGQGGFGTTLRVKNEKDQKEYVMKAIHNTNVMQEVAVLKTLKHPNIVQHNDSFEDDVNLYIVTEYCEGGDLSQEISRQKDTGVYFSEDKILTWFVDICMAVEHVHEKQILHRNIKPQNIFLDKYGRICLGDFGLAGVLERYEHTGAGTIRYRSPEINEEKTYSAKSDIWALGCVLYELCELRPVFPDEKVPDLVNKILNGPYPAISRGFSDDLSKLAGDLLQRNPADRPSASNILCRPFLLGILVEKTKGIPEDLLQKLEELNGVADGLERVVWGTTVGSLTGGVIGAAGGITTIVGLALAPFTLGASLIVSGVGIGVAALGGVTGAASNITNMVNERADRRTIENIICELDVKMQILVSCLQVIDRGFMAVDQSRSLNVGAATRAVRGLGGLLKVSSAVLAFRAASQAVRLARAAEVVTGVFAGLFLAVDIFFIVDDARAIHAMRQTGSGASNAYMQIEEEPREPPEEASAGSQRSEAVEKNALKTRDFIKKIREASAELQNWLNDLEPLYSVITDLEEAFISF